MLAHYGLNGSAVVIFLFPDNRSFAMERTHGTASLAATVSK